MDQHCSSTKTLVAIDVAKFHDDVLIECPDGSRRRMRIANTRTDWEKLAALLGGLGAPCEIAFEATGDYHRPLASFLDRKGYTLHLVSSIAVARTRDALFNSWDKNDPKDAQVILHLLKTGATQEFHDPLKSGYHDLLEIANTYQQISHRKVGLWNTIATHYLPLYFPEAEQYSHSSRAEWFTQLLILAPCRAAVAKYSETEFRKAARKIGGAKTDKMRWLTDFHRTALDSIGLPVSEESEAIRMFRLVLGEYLAVCKLRARLEKEIVERLKDHPDYQRLQTIPGIGPILALIILAESGDMRRFSHHRKFLKYCGLDLSTEQSGQFRGTSKLSKRGNARLRYAFWMAGAVAVRARENTFRQKFERYIRRDPQNGDLRRKAYTAVAAKIARVAYAIVKAGIDYRRFHEVASPGGGVRSPRSVEALATS